MPDEPYPPKTYAKLYHPPEENIGEGPRVRRRMSVAFKDAVDGDNAAIGAAIEAELGIDQPPYGYNHRVNWSKYLEGLDRGDFLSAFSILVNYIGNRSKFGSYSGDYQRKLKALRATLERIFAEEKVLLTLGEDGIIHPKIDQAFDQQRASLIRGLEGSDYIAARSYLEAVEQALLADPPDGALAIRSIFLAAENLFKQMFPKAIRLDVKSARQHIEPILAAAYDKSSNKFLVAQRQLKGFYEWIDGAHFYRHEEGQKESPQPPEELYILAVSQGFGFVRWLSDLRRLGLK